MNQLAAQVGAALHEHGMMLATAESCTGGGVATAVTEIAGSSAWFDRGFVTYANQAKMDMLGVSLSTLLRFGAVSEATVREMVAGALQHSQAHIALAVSGIAGPGGGTAEKPVGTVWFAWGMKDGASVARQYHLVGNRTEIRTQAVIIALQGVIATLDGTTEFA
jgi:nicotinamide-nucleotide amidase